MDEPGAVVAVTDTTVFAELYERILRASFPADELDSFDELAEGVASGRLDVRGIVGEDGRIVGTAVGERFEAPAERAPDAAIVLLTYLALAPDARGGGYGGRLFDAVVAEWAEEHAPCAVLLEIEHPAHHAGSDSYGDPEARLRFYARHGVRLLPVPYFMPSFGPGRARVPALLLAAAHVDAAIATDGGMLAEPVERMLHQLLAADLMQWPDDPATARLLDAVEDVETLNLLEMERLAEVPVGETPQSGQQV